MNLKHEISILRKLDHKNIVKYIYTDADSAANRVDIILEYLPGGSIRGLLEKFHRFDEKLTRIYIRQMLQGLEYLHANGVIHR